MLKNVNCKSLCSFSRCSLVRRTVLGRSVSINNALSLTCVLLDDLIVHLYDVGDSGYLEWKFVLFRETFEDWTKPRVVVSGHSGEQVVLKLVLHTTEQILSDYVVAADTTGAGEVIGHIAIGGICGDNVFCLMVAGHDNSNEEATNQNANNWNYGSHCEKPNVA